MNGERRVLIATRNPRARRIIRTCRETYPFVIQLATSDDDLTDARQRARYPGVNQKEFVAVVLDCTFQTAVESFKDFRSLYPTIPLIGVRASEDAKVRLQIADAGTSAVFFERNWPDHLLGKSSGSCLLETLVTSYFQIKGEI
jgi:hypothetical protein